jgi:hypothetical protein
MRLANQRARMKAKGISGISQEGISFDRDTPDSDIPLGPGISEQPITITPEVIAALPRKPDRPPVNDTIPEDAQELYRYYLANGQTDSEARRLALPWEKVCEVCYGRKPLATAMQEAGLA